MMASFSMGVSSVKDHSNAPLLLTMPLLGKYFRPWLHCTAMIFFFFLNLCTHSSSQALYRNYTRGLVIVTPKNCASMTTRFYVEILELLWVKKNYQSEKRKKKDIHVYLILGSDDKNRTRAGEFQ